MEKIKLNYWEKSSYMIAACDDLNVLNNASNNLKKIKNLTINNLSLPDKDNIGMIYCTYNNKEYKIGFYGCEFSIPESYIESTHVFSDKEFTDAKSSKYGITVIMDFINDPIESYYLQLKICYCLVNKLNYIYDESSERVLNPNWVKLTVESNILPSSSNLFNVHAVYKDDELWLHTHGLNRIGITELELLNIKKDKYKGYYKLLNTYANYLIEEKIIGNNIRPTDVSYIGLLHDKTKINLTYIPWNIALKEYENITLGNINDRKETHNGWTSVIFTFKDEKDLKNKKVSKIDIFEDKININTMFRISDKETNRMSSLAKENFDILKEFINKEKCFIDVKLSINDNDNKEYIWFNVISINNDSFVAKLIQEPLYVKGIKKNDLIEFTKNDIVDWVITYSDFTYTPDTLYMLRKD